MKHIVFVIGYYFPEAGSTSLCAIRVMNNLKKRYDVKISCICGTSETQGVECHKGIDVYKIHHITFTDRIEKCVTRLDKCSMRIKKSINDVIDMQYYPDMDRKFSKEMYEVLEKIEKNKHIDCIVSVYMPKQSISSALLFKDNHPEVSLVAYFLDTLRSNKPKMLPSFVHKKKMDVYEAKIFNTFNKIILMEYGLQYYSKVLCDKYSNKISYYGLPSLDIMKLKSKRSYGMQCVYIGTTYSDIRNPVFAMKVFDAANKIDSRINFHIYGSSNMKNELIAWQTNHSESFHYHDFVNHEEIIHVYEGADYIVNIGNSLKGVVPGKTFEIFGTLKPIIHFTDTTNDSSLKYIKQYPYICIINYNMGIEKATSCLLDFLNKPYCMCDEKSIETKFYYASPNAVSDLIYDTLK